MRTSSGTSRTSRARYPPQDYDLTSPVSARVVSQRTEACRSETPGAARAQFEDDAKMTDADIERQLDFERKRQMHYDEFFAVKEAREKMKKGESAQQAEDEVDKEEAKKLAKAQAEEAKEEAAEARAESAAAARAAAAAKAASKAAESEKK
ncbi:hypothetical protein MTO96_031692 [Rhipicephalus appendiculatus]